ncbi:MAG: peptidase S8, partial [Ignavibacteriae bacterium]|nr:peptidase S8 [Ignavibacteriota bacterium]
ELTVTGIEENKVVLEDYKLYQNYPNPFNPSTIISYRLKEESRVRLTVYNLNGEQIAVLADGNKEKGYHELEFKGEGLASGIYFYRMEVKDMERRMRYTDMKKMIYLK